MTADPELAAGAAFLVALGNLPERERLVLILRSQNVRVDAIADRLGVSRARVYQIERRARQQVVAELAPHADQLGAAA